MCGFSITKGESFSDLSHRGTIETSKTVGAWTVEFHSLPLSSNNTGISQPIQTDYGLIVFNGEIFNYQDLSRNRIKKSSASDVHFVRDMLLRSKGSMVKLLLESIHWDGFWSIALVKRNGKVEFFTDPLGKKQLYYSSHGIASEIKPVLPDNFMEMQYTFRHYGTSNTPFHNVFRALPGVLYEYDIENNLASVIRRSNEEFWNVRESFDLYQRIDKAVKQRLENRIDGVSIFLSGGLDSNIVLHHLMKHTQDFEAISIENDESEIVRKVADKMGYEVKFISDEVTHEDYLKAMYHYEHPLDYGSLMPNYLLFQQCSNSMVLTGDGADELFGGYARALKSDTLEYDLDELSYYHNVRLDRMSMAFTKEVRSPLMSNSLVRLAKRVPISLRRGKTLLRNAYFGILPTEVLEAPKKPLRLKQDKAYNEEKAKTYFESLCLDLKKKSRK